MPSGQMGLMLDTVGFITNLPHGLVQSFKATLEEIHHADLLVHVRDISHPQTNYQRDTVLRVLKDIGVPEEFFTNKYLEVWNKIDLVADQEEWMDHLKQELEISKPNYPVILMSCKNGTNRDEFLDQVQSQTQLIMGKKTFALRYKYSQHDRVTRWLVEHASMNSVGDDLEYGEDGMITIRVPIDEVTYQKYLKVFEPEKFEGERYQGGKKVGRFAPPPGWDQR